MKYQLKYTFTCCTVTWIVTSAIFYFSQPYPTYTTLQIEWFQINLWLCKKGKRKEKSTQKTNKKAETYIYSGSISDEKACFLSFQNS